MRKTVNLDSLDFFEEDENGQIFWKGSKIAVEQHLIISNWVNAAIILAGASSFITAIVGTLFYLHRATLN